LNLGRVTGDTDCGFRGLLKLLQSNTSMKLVTRPFKSFPINYSPAILPLTQYSL